MSVETEAYAMVYGGLAGFGLGIGLIAVALSRIKPKRWIRYAAYAGFAVIWGNGFNFLIDPSRYSPTNALSSLMGCSTAMALAPAAVWLTIKRGRERVDNIFRKVDDQN